MKRKQRKKMGYVLRKIIHFLLNGLVAIIALQMPQAFFIPVSLAVFFFVLIAELIRLNTSAKRLVNTTFDPVLKKSERGKFTGVFWASLAAAVVAPIASPVTLSYAFAIFAVADPAAAIVGKYTESKKIYQNKTVNGSLAFFIGAFIVSLFYFFLLQVGTWFIFMSAALAIILTIVEVFSEPIDDNFSLVVFATILLRGVM